MDIRKVSVIGLGTLGTQISIQAACYGYDVTAYDQDAQVFQTMIEKIKGIMGFLKRNPTMPRAEWENAVGQLDLKDCVIDL